MRKLIVTLLSMGLAASLPGIARAQFGSGIVFDPTQSGHAIVQIEHEEQSISNQMQQIENGQQIFSNTVKIASTALQTYNQVKQQYDLYHQMILAPQTLYGRFLSPQTDLMMTQQIANHYGNGSGTSWVNSSNTGTAAASSIQLASIPPLTATIPMASVTTYSGQQQIAAQGATVDLGDSVAATELQTIGTIKANQTAREPARAFEKDRLRRRLFVQRTRQCRHVGEGFNLHLRHAAHDTERSRFARQRADQLQRRLALHHHAGTVSHLRSQAQQRL
jgi:hypothetical protein